MDKKQKLWALHFGAGKIGRALIKQVNDLNNITTIYIDPFLYEKYQGKVPNSYKVTYLNQNEKEVIEHHDFRVLYDIAELQEKIANRDEKFSDLYWSNLAIISTSVGIVNFPSIADEVKNLIDARVIKNEAFVIAFENIQNASDMLKGALEENMTIPRNLLFINATVDRIVPSKQPENSLNVYSEPFFLLALQYQQKLSEIYQNGVNLSINLYEVFFRKFWFVNALHGYIAFWGSYYGKEFIHETLEIEEVLKKVSHFKNRLIAMTLNFLEDSDRADEDVLPFFQSYFEGYFDRSIERFKNPYLKDSIERVGQNAKLKLSIDNRFGQIYAVNKALNRNFVYVETIDDYWINELVALAILHLNEMVTILKLKEWNKEYGWEIDDFQEVYRIYQELYKSKKALKKS